MRKTGLMFAMSAMLVSAMVSFAQQPSPTWQRSRNLTKNEASADYLLATDGRWNYWRQDWSVDLSAVSNAMDARIDDAELQTIANLAYIYGYPRVIVSTNFLTNTVSIASMDVAGATKSGHRLLRIWVSTNTMSPATTNNIESLTLSTGNQFEEVTADADYWYFSATGGTAIATIEATVPGTNYLMVVDGAAVVSTPIVFD